jgi:Amt family ammonium transporter
MLHDTILVQFAYQAMSCLVTIVYSGVISFVLLKGIDLTLGLRVTTEEESQGLDIALHEETGYVL